MNVKIKGGSNNSGKIVDMSFGGLKVELKEGNSAFIKDQLVGKEISMLLRVPKNLERLILYESPLNITVKVIRVHPESDQFGAQWGDINPVVLSTLIHSLTSIGPEA